MCVSRQTQRGPAVVLRSQDLPPVHTAEGPVWELSHTRPPMHNPPAPPGLNPNEEGHWTPTDWRIYTPLTQRSEPTHTRINHIEAHFCSDPCLWQRGDKQTYTSMGAISWIFLWNRIWLLTVGLTDWTFRHAHTFSQWDTTMVGVLDCTVVRWCGQTSGLLVYSFIVLTKYIWKVKKKKWRNVRTQVWGYRKQQILSVLIQ